MLNKRDLPKFDPDQYKKFSLNDLLLCSAYYFQKDDVPISSEDLISACFLLFPKRFALRNYPHWPDSAMVSRRWIECRINGYLFGSATEGFKITTKGTKYAERVAKKLGMAKPKAVQTAKRIAKTPAKQSKQSGLIPPKKAPAPLKVTRVQTAIPPRSKRIHPPTDAGKPRRPTGKRAKSVEVMISKHGVKVWPQDTDKIPVAPVGVSKELKIRVGKFVHLMERSDAYRQYKKQGKNAKIGEFDFRSLLLCTMESSRETLMKNLALFRGYALIQGRQDLLVFLNHCEDRFSYLLLAPQKQVKKPLRKSTK